MSGKQADSRQNALFQAADLQGKWQMEMKTLKTDYRPYRGMILGFVTFIDQNGSIIKGNAEKSLENGKSLSGTRRTKMTLDGTIQEEQVVINYNHYGTERNSIGQIIINEQMGKDSLRGTFYTTVANSSGSVLLYR